MLVCHGTWLILNGGGRGRFFLWAEASPSPSPPLAVDPRPERAGAKEVPNHPFAAPAAALRRLVAETGRPGSPPDELPEASLVYYLPSTPEAPLPSPELRPYLGDLEVPLLPPRRSRGRPKAPAARPWRIPGLLLTVRQLFFWFWALEAAGEVPDLTWGADLRFWQMASHFTLELLARQRYLPGFRRLAEGRLAAAWQPFLEGQDAGRFACLAGLMPPVARAWSLEEDGAASPAAPAATALLEHFLAHAVDGLVRQWLPGVTVARRRPSRTTEAAGRWWLRALSCPDPEKADLLPAQPELEADWQAWVGQVKAAGAGFRTCFQLEPPAPDGQEGQLPADSEPWILRFFLQAVDDPSLLLPAEMIWRGAATGSATLDRRLPDPQEKLLADLGRAARFFPPLERSLSHPCPEAAWLSAAEAAAFLREAVPLFREAGFGVFLPSWWGKGPTRLGLRLRLKRPRKSGGGNGFFGLDTLVAYDWKVALGDVELTPEEFAQLASLKVPLVRVRGQWVEIDPDQAQQVLELWQKHRRQEMRLGEALALALAAAPDAAAEDDGLPVVGVEAEGALAELLARLRGEGRWEELPQPAGFCGELRPYQRRGFSWLSFLSAYGFGACLADDMGLGKTVQLLAWVLHAREQGLLRGPVLLLCPTSVAANWQHEAARFAPTLKVLVHHGIGRLAGEEFVQAASQHDLVVSTYSLAHRDAATLGAVKWAAVVLDEAQNIKNHETKQAKSIRRLAADYRIALTGTPVENRLDELWSIMEFLNPGYLGPYAEFRRRFAIPVERYHDEARARALRRLVQPFILRRLKTDPQIISDLPEKQENKVYCYLTKEQATLYEAVVRDMLEKIEAAEGMERRGLVLATISKLKQVCNHPAHFLGEAGPLAGRSGKLARLTEMLAEVEAEGDKALIFTQFAEMGHLLRRFLQETFGREVLFLHGGVPAKARDKLVQRFQEEEGRRAPFLFVISLKAGGTGLNLTRASHVFHFDRWWNPAVENQATDRAFRIGQKKMVQVHKFVCVGTLEERIDAMIAEKQQLADLVVTSGEAWLTEMSTAELRRLLTLEQSAVAED